MRPRCGTPSWDSLDSCTNMTPRKGETGLSWSKRSGDTGTGPGTQLATWVWDLVAHRFVDPNAKKPKSPPPPTAPPPTTPPPTAPPPTTPPPKLDIPPPAAPPVIAPPGGGPVISSPVAATPAAGPLGGLASAMEPGGGMQVLGGPTRYRQGIGQRMPPSLMSALAGLQRLY